MSTDIKPSIEYTRSLYDDVVYWYRNADTKAQILLTLIGVFIGFLTSTVFVKVDDLKDITHYFDKIIWFTLSIMATTVTLSVFAALACLWSRIRLRDETREELDTILTNTNHPISGRIIGYFETLWRLPQEKFESSLMVLSYDDEVRIRAAQIHALSRHVHWKHIFVNIGFVLGGLSLLFYLLAAALFLTSV
jgi:hypothetical protein